MSKPRQIFRRVALDRLASPDRVDRPLRVVGGAGWLALVAILAGLGGFLFWVVGAEAPVKVQARGIVISAGGLDQIVANTHGRLKALNVHPGDRVAAGQVVATFEQAELSRELEAANAKLADARQRYEQLSEFYRENDRREAELALQRIETIQQSRELLLERLILLNKRHDGIASLVDRKVITDEELIDAQLELSDVRERLAALDDEEMALAARKQERLSEQRLALLDEELEIRQSLRLTERLEARLEEQLNLLSPHAGRVVEVMADPGEVVEPGQALATVASANDTESTLTVFLFVNPADGKRIRAGMLTEIIPAAFRPEEFGYMLGRVEVVSELPATLAGMRRVLKNDELARELTQAGVPFEVRVSLLADPNTTSGYRWSSSRGPDAEINAGMLVSARVIVNRVRLISLAIPQFNRVLAMWDG
ncbi:NHLP bacteriocin system secretion protein [Lamprobacter modestohalophilus]|uniref:NHLP bacteriocin system secretion protein n=1 Tax=Lamprobacter modestohalophilus TaxID=1064514 RepID=UPI002ADEE573|nr:NHLP bacteriocin system secretion protein [Lamprobacter modestohalophilus]MEA1051738.1 NHLP bacteriocin system secretion protein [Lamprobacter modestohalophilus]